MSVWPVKDVEKVPEIVLSEWKIFEVTSPYWEGTSRHFVGYNVTENEGRVSSEIVDFDPLTLEGRTRSGRVYRLEGEPGTNEDAEYVWEKWININDVDSTVDVTKEYQNVK